jgi:uncharacterized protein (TIGR03083 family)
VDIAEHIDALRHQGELMAKAVAAVDAGASIPTCPEWTMRDLVLHQGEVHRWATTIVADGRTEPVGDDVDFVGPLPDDAGLVEWFRDGCDALTDALESADPQLDCWSFLVASSPVAFWARRQCHETGMHRADAESASGAITRFPPALAADGIDELLTGFVTRPKTRLKSETTRALAVRPTDTASGWTLRIADRIETTRALNDADCVISAPASDLHLFLWNRIGRDAIHVVGDESLLDEWRDKVTIRWS